MSGRQEILVVAGSGLELGAWFQREIPMSGFNYPTVVQRLEDLEEPLGNFLIAFVSGAMDDWRLTYLTLEASGIACIVIVADPQARCALSRLSETTGYPWSVVGTEQMLAGFLSSGLSRAYRAARDRHKRHRISASGTAEAITSDLEPVP